MADTIKKRPYYITWYERKNNKSRWFIICNYFGESAKEVKAHMDIEQNYRRVYNKPHMFHLTVSLSRPSDAALRERGHLYY